MLVCAKSLWISSSWNTQTSPFGNINLISHLNPFSFSVWSSVWTLESRLYHVCMPKRTERLPYDHLIINRFTWSGREAHICMTFFSYFFQGSVIKNWNTLNYFGICFKVYILYPIWHKKESKWQQQSVSAASEILISTSGSIFVGSRVNLVYVSADFWDLSVLATMKTE